MKLKDITDKYSTLNIYEERRRTNDYEELVFYKTEYDQWDRLFREIFGPPSKPAGGRPSKEDRLLTESYGGIREDQILFKSESKEGTIVAMFWPWQDDIHCTLKVIQINK